MKAVLFNKETNEIIEVIENVSGYDESNISGSSVIQGLSPHIGFKLLDNSVEIPYEVKDRIKVFQDIDLNSMSDLKPDQDRKKALEEIREMRNQIIDEVDTKYCNAHRWGDMSETEKQAWRDYKQALLDFPETCDIDNPVWPEKPN
jgi:hypothetical protein